MKMYCVFKIYTKFIEIYNLKKWKKISAHKKMKKGSVCSNGSRGVQN